MLTLNCAICGKERRYYPSNGAVKYCGMKCYNIAKKGMGNPNWKGGTLHAKDGYLYTYLPSHPDAIKLGYVLQHRLAMEEHLGRRLLKTEAVHHINGNRRDNRIENLVCCSSVGKHFIEHHIEGRDSSGRFAKESHTTTK
jgi:hypothetical protein